MVWLVGKRLIIAFLIVILFINSGDGGNPDGLLAFANLNKIACTEVVNVRSDPPSIVQIPQ